MKKVISLLLIATPMMISCAGQSSNPLKDYTSLQGVPPGPEVKPQTAEVAPSDVFSIDLSGTSQVNNGNYFEGQEGQVLVRVLPKAPQITKFDVSISDFSRPDRPVLVPTADPKVFALKWKPPVGIITGNLPSVSLNIEIQAVVTEASDSRLKNLIRKDSFTINVLRNISQPKILGKNNFPTEVEESPSAISFSVDIEDPSTATNPRLPEIQITSYPYSNTEAYRGDASRYVSLDADTSRQNPEKLSSTKWRFYFLLQVDQLPLDRDRVGHVIPSASSVDMCFQMRAFSSIQTASGQEPLCFKGKYAAQPPTVTVVEDTKEIKAGVETVITVKASVAHPMSTVSTKSQQIKCEPDVAGKNNALTCVIKIKPACTRSNVARNINVKFDSLLNGKVKSTTLTKELTVIPNPEACPVSQAPAAQPRSQQRSQQSAQTPRQGQN